MSLSLIPKERRKSKKKMMTIAKESSSSKAKDEVSVITAEPINMADIATITNAPPASRATRPAQRGIVIWELA